MAARAILSLSLVTGLCAPAFADTVVCVGPDSEPKIEIAVDFGEMREAGEVTGLRLKGRDFDLSTYDGDAGGASETIAFSEVSFDRIQLGLEAENTMYMVLVVDLVRAAVFDSTGGDDTDVVVAGVANIGGERTTTLLCSGW